MKKLHRFLIMTVLVAMLVGICAIASSAAATMTPAKVLAEADGSQSVAASSGTQRCSVTPTSKSSNTYYTVDFVDSGANCNVGSGYYAFLGKGDYIITEFDFMAEDWTKVKNILVGWNSRNSTKGALNDMHFSFSNENGAPKISGNPLTGSIVLDPTPGAWHHFTLVVEIDGEHIVKNGTDLTAVQGQDAVEAYAYIDGELFAKNLVGDGKEFWSKDTTFFQSFRMTASGGDQQLCFDNLRIVQYEANNDLREFFRYRQQNGGEFPDINKIAYPFLAYDADYQYPLGIPNCKVVELNGTEVLFDRFDRATKYATKRSGAKLVLLADIKDAVVNYPVLVDRAEYELLYTANDSLRVEENEVVNPITGALSRELSFIKKTKFAFYRWYVDHTGEVLDSRGYTPVAIGTPIVYDGTELASSYYRDGVLYTFDGVWMLNGVAISSVPAYAANSYYTLVPVIEAADVYAIFRTAEGETVYALSPEDAIANIASAAKDTVVTLIRDLTVTAPIEIKSRITLDLAGKKITATGDSAFLVTADASGTVITSTAEGASIEASGAILNAGAACTLSGKNISAAAASLVKAEGVAKGVVISGGTYLISGDVLALSAEASLGASIDATLIGSGALADPAKTYAVTLGGALCGITVSASSVSTVSFKEGLVLTYGGSFASDKLPEGVTLAQSGLVVAAKKADVDGDGVIDASFVVADVKDVATLVWLEGAVQYVAIGEDLFFDYSDYYDATKYYTPNGVYDFAGEGVAVTGNVALDSFAGLTLAVEPHYDSSAFYVVAVKPDGTYVPYLTAANLTDLMASGAFEDGTLFAVGKKNVISIENLVLENDYALDLNGYAVSVYGANKIKNGSLKIFSSVAGGGINAEAASAFILEGGKLEIAGENVVYYGNTLAELDAASALVINGGVYVVKSGAFYNAADGATVAIEALAASAELFAAAEGYAWTAVSESVTIGGIDCAIVAKYAKVAE